jgi:hypothetical protein
MAGNGPPPKKPSERRRRNKDKPPETELPAEGYTGEYPPLPAAWGNTVTEKIQTANGDEDFVSKTIKVTFLDETRDWYEIWATSPMAHEFTAVDWNRLQRVAKLVDQFNRKPSKDLMAEIRLQEASFGGTPMDRRKLGQVIGGASGKSGRQPRASSEAEAKARRARLRAAS